MWDIVSGLSKIFKHFSVEQTVERQTPPALSTFSKCHALILWQHIVSSGFAVIPASISLCQPIYGI